MWWPRWNMMLNRFDVLAKWCLSQIAQSSIGFDRANVDRLCWHISIHMAFFFYVDIVCVKGNIFGCAVFFFFFHQLNERSGEKKKQIVWDDIRTRFGFCTQLGRICFVWSDGQVQACDKWNQNRIKSIKALPMSIFFFFFLNNKCMIVIDSTIQE